jgi:hypothetical protein
VYFARLNGDGRTKKEKKRSQVHIVEEMMLGQFLFDVSLAVAIGKILECFEWMGMRCGKLCPVARRG